MHAAEPHPSHSRSAGHFTLAVSGAPAGASRTVVIIYLNVHAHYNRPAADERTRAACLCTVHTRRRRLFGGRDCVTGHAKSNANSAPPLAAHVLLLFVYKLRLPGRIGCQRVPPIEHARERRQIERIVVGKWGAPVAANWLPRADQ